MVTDHGQANDELKKIAAQKNASLPFKLESKLKSNVEPCSSCLNFSTSYTGTDPNVCLTWFKGSCLVI